MIRRIAIWTFIFIAVGAVAWLWPRIDRPPTDFEIGFQLLQEGRADQALLFFDNAVWRGVGEYRAGRYARAVGEFAAEETILNLYNMGNAFAKLHDWNNAIASYQRVLRFVPGHADAQYNLELVIQASELEAKKSAPQHEPQQSLASPMELKAAKPEEGDSTSSETGQNNPSDTAGKSSDTDEIGEGRDPGQLAAEKTTDEVGSATAIGKTTDDDTDQDRDIVGSARLKARESSQAAEILLRKIHDDPEKVLRARIYTAHKERSGGSTQ